ncbi:FAD-dependent thymidylate synthase [Fusibacter tunisiensis]|uniref:Flavin-dependent thymidylate synthase n=1 Tax=Fusibacter tunisiensis TaxID=1008308 RepID=A0ABS2MQU2_9FIRM|nr:FAD-dependent thymidylate synthase [Fusibacter tunisiensis]MBM7561776.1 thymidylate synthase (FAD) [Fusibacter tunisiensis]
MKVQLLAHTPDPERIIAGAAKLCYSAVGIDALNEKLDSESVTSFLNKLMALGHESPLEHVSFTFGIEGVSRVLTHQLVRHRIASYSQQSQRYVKLDAFEYVTPPAILKIPKAKALFDQAMAEDQKIYNELTEILENGYYKEMIAAGMTEKKARSQSEKKAVEDARFVFPNACETKIVVTMNARSLMNFFNHRCCNRAQWEIQALAIEMLRIVRGVAPGIFNNSGPGCLVGPCPEGKMTCGEINEVRQFFKTL